MRREYAEAITVAVPHICLCHVQSYRWNTEKHVDRPQAVCASVEIDLYSVACRQLTTVTQYAEITASFDVYSHRRHFSQWFGGTPARRLCETNT